MKFIRHLLSHLLLISVIAAVCGVYFYRNQVLPESYVQKINGYAEKIHPRLVGIASTIDLDDDNKKQAETKISLDANAAPNTASIATDMVPEAEEVSMETLANESESTVSVSEIPAETNNANQTEVTVLASEAVKKETATVIADNEVADQTENETSKTNVKAEKVAEQPATTDKQATDYQSILRGARIAYEKGNMDLAIKKYSELIEIEHDVADFYGELGNVYYAMGNWQEAGVSYYEAAVRLMEKGQLSQVNYLQRVIQGLDAERAEKLSNKMVEVYRVNGIAR